MEKIEFLILRNLLFNEEYVRKVLPFIKEEYFEDEDQKKVFLEVFNFISQYNKIPTQEILCIEFENKSDINQEEYQKIIHLINSLENIPVDKEWLIDTTEKWCRD